MSFFLPDLKTVQKRSQYVVFGYIKQIEITYNIKNIPSLICFICLPYYYEYEHFMKPNDDCIMISDDQKTVTKKSKSRADWDNITFLNKWIDSTNECIVEWNFHITKKSKYTLGLMFGFLTKQTKDTINKNSIELLEYGWCNRGYLCNFKKINDRSFRVRKKGMKFTQNHTMIVELNLFESKIYLTIIPDNDNEKNEWSNTKQLLYENIEKSKNIKYKFAVLIRIPNDCIELKSFASKSVTK